MGGRGGEGGIIPELIETKQKSAKNNNGWGFRWIDTHTHTHTDTLRHTHTHTHTHTQGAVTFEARGLRTKSEWNIH